MNPEGGPSRLKTIFNYKNLDIMAIVAGIVIPLIAVLLIDNKLFFLFLSMMSIGVATDPTIKDARSKATPRQNLLNYISFTR